MKYNSQNKLKVFTAFSGYDSQCMGLDRLVETFGTDKFDYELVGWSEIGKDAIKAHDAVYPQYQHLNYGDIEKIEWSNVPNFDLFTYSYPCTDISSAGKQAGLEEGSGTRSSLLWECKRAIQTKLPKYCLMENVKALTQKKFIGQLQKWLDFMSGLGYKNFTKVLDATDYGVAQHRERVFVVSILDENADYQFPEPYELDKCIENYLEDEVDDKFFLAQERVDKLVETMLWQTRWKEILPKLKGIRNENRIKYPPKEELTDEDIVARFKVKAVVDENDGYTISASYMDNDDEILLDWNFISEDEAVAACIEYIRYNVIW